MKFYLIKKPKKKKKSVGNKKLRKVTSINNFKMQLKAFVNQKHKMVL